jgi:hypothetical protein
MTLFSNENSAKKLLLNILDFLRYKVANDECTAEEIRRFADVAAKELDVLATTEDLAEFYSQPLYNVHNILKRKPIPKDKTPKRRVYISFNLFSSLIPKSWKHKEE